MKKSRVGADNRATLSENGVHWIDEDLTEDWLESFISDGLDEVEAYLRKHSDFQTFLEDRD
jgi:hypothetical protein